jgi:tetratricopeptide (TPR) repeat protein
VTAPARTAARLVAAAAIAAAVAAAPAGPARASPAGEFARAARMLQEWRFDEARAAIDELAARRETAPEVRYLRAELAFLDGDYPRAIERLDGLDDDAVYGNVGHLRALAASTLATTREFARYDSPGGHFTVLYPPGKEEVIVELVADVLERAHAVIGEDLGVAPAGRIRVEILSRPSDLARVSTLTEKDIETTGTIALCKYNKLMVVTPRATLFGYPWMDTLVHEYVHYAVAVASHDNVPVWLQEGLARFEQTRWRRDPTTALSQVEEHLLATALKQRKLIEFDAMHPSMAKLPSQEAAALAFAEVYTMIGYLHGAIGYPGLRQVLASIRAGRPAQRAIADAAGKRWPQIERDWQQDLRRRDLHAAPRAARQAGRIRFRKADAPEAEDNAGVDQVASEKARNLARLGGMLRARGMPDAAAVEYEKALAAGGDDPFVAGKLARTYLDLGRHEQAIRLAAPLAAQDEADAEPPTTLGVAHRALGRTAEAVAAFELALRINPFDPRVRCGLADAYGDLGRAALADREQRACATLGGQ